MSCPKNRSDRSKRPVRTQDMRERRQTYVWKAVKENPNLYCWMPASLRKNVVETVAIEDVNIQDIPPAPYPKDYNEIVRKLADNAKETMETVLREEYKKNPSDPRAQVMYDDKQKYAITKDFIKERDRVLYGGTAMNMYLPKEAKFYNRGDTPDYDFYSPSPWEDAVDLADRLYDAGFNYTSVRTGVHKGTIKVFANFYPVADITYVPQEMYDRIPTRKKQGIRVIAPEVVMEDYYLQAALAPERWEKIEKRIVRFKKWVKPLGRKFKCSKDIFLNENTKLPEKDILDLWDICYDYIHTRKLPFGGSVAYNTYVQAGGGKERVLTTKFEAYSETARSDVDTLFGLLAPLVGDIHDLHVYSTYETYKALNNTSYVITYKGEDICKITDITVCIPVKYISDKWIVGIDYLKYEMYLAIAYGEDEEVKNTSKCLLKYLNKVQANFYKKRRKKEWDDSPFQRFIPRCVGPSRGVVHEALLQRWVDSVDHKKTIRVIKPKKDTITISGVKGKRIEILPKGEISGECIGKGEGDCVYPCVWNRDYRRCFDMPIGIYKAGQRKVVPLAPVDIDPEAGDYPVYGGPGQGGYGRTYPFEAPAGGYPSFGIPAPGVGEYPSYERK